MTPAPPPLPEPKRDWWSRNWKRFVPVAVVSVVLVIGGLVMGVTRVMKSTDAYRGAVARAKAAPAVRAALGTPIEEGFFVLGQVEAGRTDGSATLTIPLSGPKGKATLFVAATKAAGEWRFHRLLVRPENAGVTIDLSDKAAK